MDRQPLLASADPYADGNGTDSGDDEMLFSDPRSELHPESSKARAKKASPAAAKTTRSRSTGHAERGSLSKKERRLSSARYSGNGDSLNGSLASVSGWNLPATSEADISPQDAFLSRTEQHPSTEHSPLHGDADTVVTPAASTVVSGLDGSLSHEPTLHTGGLINESGDERGPPTPPHAEAHPIQRPQYERHQHFEYQTEQHDHLSPHVSNFARGDYGMPPARPRSHSIRHTSTSSWEFRKKDKLSHVERMTTSPFEKFKRYRRIPYKFILSIAIVVSITVFYAVRNVEYSVFLENATSSMRHVLGNDVDDDGSNLLGTTNFFSTPGVINSINNTVTNYFRFNDTAASYFTVSDHVDMYFQLEGAPNVSHYVLNTNYTLGPFQDLDLIQQSTLLRSARHLRLEFSFSDVEEQDFDRNVMFSSRFKWRCYASYAVQDSGGRVAYNVRVSSYLLEASSPILIVINSIIIVLNVVSAILTGKALLKSLAAYRYARVHLSGMYVQPGGLIWSDLDFSDKLAFFNMWHVTSIVADVLLVLGSAMMLSREEDVAPVDYDNITGADFMRAMGTFLAWCSLIKYMEWDVELYMLILAVKASVIRVLKFCLCVAPVYLAYTIVGVALFSNHPDVFGDFFRSSVTLFALLNGDSILMIFQTLQSRSTPGYAIVAQIYLYTFCIFGITIILNVFIFIIESGYDAALGAVYGPDDELSVFIDHRRLKEILVAAHHNDPNTTNHVKKMIAEMGQPDDELFRARVRSATLKHQRAMEVQPQETRFPRARLNTRTMTRPKIITTSSSSPKLRRGSASAKKEERACCCSAKKASAADRREAKRAYRPP